jgi:hypothetical protein
VVRKTSGSVNSGGYNVSDKAGGTTATTSGWNFIATDVQATGLPLHTATFKPFSTGVAYQGIAARPEGYPTVDFYGTAIPATNAMAGAVQDAITTSGYMLDYGATGPGTVSVTDGSADGYGMYTGSVTLTATNSANGVFVHWTVDGTKQLEQTPPNKLTLAMDGHKTVRGVFATAWQVTSGANEGTGSLRQAITSAATGDYIVLAPELTVTLTATLHITNSLVIEGNGSTLTQTGLTTSNANQLLTISSATAEVRISRLHFKGGRSNDYGSAIRNTGKLTLESCIFTDNITEFSNSYAYGGAICTTSGSLTVLGCTFTGNQALATGNGAAIYRQSGTLSLTGNIFAGNSAPSYSVVYSATTTGGYNVSDKPTGTTAAGSGWNFDANDVQREVAFDSAFKPSSAGGLPVIPSLPAGFPTTYFDGTSRGSNSTPGAMPLNQEP